MGHTKKKYLIKVNFFGSVFSGFITLPLDARNKILKVELSVVPSLDGLLIHPHLLHLTVFGESQKKASYKTPLKSASDWRMNFIVEYGTKVYHIPNYGNQRKVQLPDNCLENKNGEIRLLLGNNKLLINIISSLQGNSKKEDADSDGHAITNIDVIERRIEEESWQYPELQSHGKDLSKKLATKYTSKEFKVELHRCRLRACIYDEATKTLNNIAVSEVISNARDKNVGYLDLRSISDPGCCCTKGGWRFFLISEHKLARDKASPNKQDTDEESDRSPPVVPMLVLADNDNNVVEDINGAFPLNQIPTDPDSFEVHGDAFSIILPPQNPIVLDKIRRQGLHFRIFLYRCLDKKFSNSSVKFVYYDHGAFEGNCPFCLIKRISQSSLECSFNPGTGSGKRPRKRAKTSSGSVQSPADSTMTMSPYSDSTSSGISSPGSSGGTPEHIPCNSNDHLSSYNNLNNSVGTFSYTSGSSTNGFYSQEIHSMEEWSDVQGAIDNSNEIALPEDLDGLWIPEQIGPLIFEFGNDDLNTRGSLPLADSWIDVERKVEEEEETTLKPEEEKDFKSSAKKVLEKENPLEDEKVVKEEKPVEEEKVERDVKVQKKEDEVEEAFNKMRLTEVKDFRPSKLDQSTNTTSLLKSDHWLEISAVLFAVLLYYIGGYLWK